MDSSTDHSMEDDTQGNGDTVQWIGPTGSNQQYYQPQNHNLHQQQNILEPLSNSLNVQPLINSLTVEQQTALLLMLQQQQQRDLFWQQRMAVTTTTTTTTADPFGTIQSPQSSMQQTSIPLQLQSNHFQSHNLIPSHMQSTFQRDGLLFNLSGTPGYPSAIIPLALQFHSASSTSSLPPVDTQQFAIPSPSPNVPLFTVQDYPLRQPMFNGVHPAYPGLRILNNDPPLFCVDNFLSPAECDFLIHNSQDIFGPAPVVGKGEGEVSPSRTSSTCYLSREDLPGLLQKISCLTGKPIEHCELPQVGRYYPSQQYLQHFDAFDLSSEDGRRFASNGGQRTVTVLIYLNTVGRGGATRFPALNLDIQPVQGMALIFFPATVDGLLDKRALHAALPAIDTKYVSQVWIRQTVYSGQTSKRLPQSLGGLFG